MRIYLFFKNVTLIGFLFYLVCLCVCVCVCVCFLLYYVIVLINFCVTIAAVGFVLVFFVV